MLSRTSEYALRAMVFLAQHVGEWPVPGRRIAGETGIPPKYLSSILSSLVRAKVLTASPGKGGGFAMIHPPDTISLRAILEPFESGFGPSRPCPFGNEVCHDDNPCAGHKRWKVVKEAYSRFLEETTVYDVSVKQAGRKGSNTRKRR